ncbi:NAD(P)/FAD-dependent oxidoreductase [Gordonia sp. PDNC005]|uniref:flavin-containing monooxygenase n=1 Tax=unclassified Gordonia (in: high G+C Gram-positive bacteria) TaxID=2657482 RepID=UPI001963FB61|nr:NAD(P)/FAD-dependent oxidoreductase [Gordonia sp. PDNC005]QRY61983.1 NAD(P)/FAD-dependent oxidoreductase [Gordonia sp. PDNC005]
MSRSPRVIVIGAGVAGITTAHILTQRGFTDLTVLEKGDAAGGVWHWNKYPGLTCDVPSNLYQFGFAPKPDWERMFATGPQIKAYLNDVIDELGLRSRIELNAEVTSAVFNDDEWTVTLADGRVFVSDFVVMATGVLHNPYVPDIPGLDTFTGPVVHSARWDDTVETRGRRIAVIGSGSTGVQLVTALQREADRVVHFSRTPQWVMWAPMDRRQSRLVTALLIRFPALRTGLYRTLLSGSGFLADIATTPSWRRRAVQQYARLSLRAQVRDRADRATLTPDYEPMCKRQVLSGGYYRAIQAPNAEVVDSPIVSVTPDGIITDDGVEHPLDLIVLATGFRAHDYMRPMDLRGRDGVRIDDVWADGPRAYRMSAIPGFPNLFTTLGPNSPTGSISLQYTAERTAEFIADWLDRFAAGAFTTVEVTDEATDDFLADANAAMIPTVWATGCDSWYLTPGGDVDLWPYDRATLTAMLTEQRDDHFRFTRTSEPAESGDDE